MKRNFLHFALIFLFILLFVCLFCLAAGAESYADDATAVAAGAVARVGTAGGDGYYPALDAALAVAADGDTVTLLADATLASAAVDKKITLDGAGHTLKSDGIAAGTKTYWLTVTGEVTFRNVRIDAGYLFALNAKSGAKVTFTDKTSLWGIGSGVRNILIYNEAGASMIVDNGCVLTVENAPANNAVTATVKNNGTLHVYGVIRNLSTRTDQWNRCIHGDSTGKNGFLYLYDGGLIELPSGGSSTKGGGAVFTNGTFVMTGGAVRTGSNASNGAIYINSAKAGLHHRITGGTIETASPLCAVKLVTTTADTSLEIGGTAKIIATDTAAAAFLLADTTNAANGTLTLTLSGTAALSSKKEGIRLTGKTAVNLNVTGGTITAMHGIFGNDKNTPVAAVFEGGSITAANRAVSLSNGKYHITFRGGTFTATGSDKACVSVLGGANSGSEVTITGGEFIARKNTMTALALWGSVGAKAAPRAEDMNANIYGGYFYSEYIACVHVQQGAVASIWGGVFENAGSKGDASPGNAVRVGYTSNVSGEVHVFGGIFFLRGLYGGVFGVVESASSATDYAYCVLDIQGYTAVGGTGAVRNYGTGTPHTAWAASRNRGTRHAPVTARGAQVRYTAGTTGLRFVSGVSKETMDYLTGIADAGSITYGTVIAPREYADSVSVFTAELLARAGKKYLDIPAVNGITENADGSLTLRAAIVNLKKENIAREFAGAAYVQYRVNGVVCRMYASYQPDLNARSAEQVARLALTSGSTFTAAQTEVLTGYWNPETAVKKVLDVYLIAGQSNASGSTYATNAFKNSDPQFTAGYENIYYSGVSRTAIDDILPTNKVNFVQPAKVGMGKTSDFMGPELGIAKALSAYYNGAAGNEAAIIKYGAGGTRLFDKLSGTDKPEGNWTPPTWLKTHTPAGEKSGGLYRNFLSLVEETVYYYRVLGYTEINLCGIFWMQGESDRQDVNVATYTDLFATLAADMRNDFAGVFDSETANAPVLVGEISKGFDNAINTTNLSFVELQRGLAEKVSDTYMIHSSEYISGTRADDAYHWTCEDMLQIGLAVGRQFLTLRGQGALIPAPAESDYVAEVFDSAGTSLGRYVSLAWAINTAPAGATVKLLRDVTLTASLNLGNKNAVTFDGNGYTMTVRAADTAIRLTNVELTFVNVKLVNTIKSATAYGITCFAGAKLNFASGSITTNGADYAVYKAQGTPDVTLAADVTVTGAANVSN